MLLADIINLVEHEQFDEAERISEGSTDPDVLGIKAMIPFCNGDHLKVIDAYEKILKLKPKNASIFRYYFALSLFTVGRLREGFQHQFEAELAGDTFLGNSLKRFPGKQIFVKQPAPATIHIHADAGDGDNLQLMRYFNLILKEGYKIQYEAKPGLVKLAQDSFPEISVIPRASDFPGSEGIPDFDYHLPICCLPFIYQTDIDTIPWDGSYLKYDPDLVKNYSSYKGRIGICWSTGPKSGLWRERYLYRKSILLEELKPVIELDPTRFVAVQAGPIRVVNKLIDDALPKDETKLTWAETAALVENLDLVISIDTSVAHLAGAMGKPVLVMLSDYSTGYQMLAKDKNSCWYPTMKIFKQVERGNWNSVISDIKKELKCLIQT